ncbi:MAG: hypothetical protein ACRC7J_06855, partial [Vibrio ordalii]
GTDDATDAQRPTSALGNVQGVEDTGVTKNGPLQSNAPQHHRGGDFDALIGAQIAHSQASARLVADELQEKPVIGATGTHRWQQAEQGSWVLQPNNPVQAQTASAMGGSPQSTPINAPASEGTDDATDAQRPTSAFDNVKRSYRTSVKDNPQPKAALHRGGDVGVVINSEGESSAPREVTNDISTIKVENTHLDTTPTVSQGSQVISESSPSISPMDLSKKISSSWTKVTADGRVRWNNAFQSSDIVLLTAGSVSGLGGNYTQGQFNNLCDIKEHQKNRLNNLQSNLSSKDYKALNVLDGKLAWPLQEANLKIA